MEDQYVQFNTNISDYTIADLFNLLDITVTKNTEVNDVKNEIKTKTQKLIDQFTELNKPTIVDFFKNIRASLLGTDEDTTLTSAEKLLIELDKSYKPFSNKNFITSSDNLFSHNSGAGNPLNRKTVTKLLNIDSRFRENYSTTSSTNFIINLPYSINNVIETRLCDLEFPTTYHPITNANQNNYFWFATYTQSQITSQTPNIYYFIVPDGNYYFDNLIKLMNTTFKSINTNELLVGDFNPLPISAFFDLNYNNLGGVGNGTGHLSMGLIPSNTDDVSLNRIQNIVKIEFNFDSPPIPGVTTSTRVVKDNLKYLYYQSSTVPVEQRFGWMLGFRQKHYTTDLYYISESILDITGPKYLYLIIDDFNQNTNINFIDTSKYGLLPDNIIARISVKCAAFNIQSQNDFSVYSEPRYYYGPVNISKIQIRVIDEFGRTLDINSNDFSFTLRMTTIYSVT
jgi:hypothetical protein